MAIRLLSNETINGTLVITTDDYNSIVVNSANSPSILLHNDNNSYYWRASAEGNGLYNVSLSTSSPTANYTTKLSLGANLAFVSTASVVLGNNVSSLTEVRGDLEVDGTLTVTGLSGTITLQKSIQLPTTTTNNGTPSDVGVLSFGGDYTNGNRLFVDSSGGTFRIQGSGNLQLYAPNFSLRNSGGALIIAGTGVTLYYSNQEKLLTTSTGIKVDGNIKLGDDTMSTPSSNADDIVIDKDSSEAGITIMSETAGSVRWGDASNSSIGSIEYNHNSDYMRLIVNAAERMRIDSAGNVGIGLITPGAKLDVLQEARVSYANSNQYTLRITNTDGNPRILADGSAAHLIFGTTPSGSATATERVRIQNDGNVGIGTTSPDGALQVTAASSTTSNGNDASFKLYLTNTNTTNNNYSLINFTDSDGGASSGGMGLQYTDHANDYGDLCFITRGSGGYG